MILVSEENSLRIRHHAFSRPLHAKIFQTFDRSHYPNGMIVCDFMLYLAA